ncbi:MAG TPA: hypothetical protein VMS17_33360 [Gemmataceae bacterium]|nr:hypothetical protein [Gemmataceae bacterium]
MKKLYCLLAIAVFAVSLAPARAGLLAPGTMINVTGSPSPAGTVILDTGPVPIASSGGDFTATLEEIVLRDSSTHGVDFLFQIINSAASHTSIVTLQDGFGSTPGTYDGPAHNGAAPFYTVIADFSNNAAGMFSGGTDAPSTATRTSNGKNVFFSFPASGGTPVAAGDTSKWVFFNTNASGFTVNPIQLTGNSGDTAQDSTDFFGPTGPFAPAPSPTVLACSALPILALGMWLARRKKAKPSPVA